MIIPSYQLTANEASIVISPSVLFPVGTIGAWYDPSDLTTLFQDSAGTIPVTADGDPVGLMQDKSGNGYNATQTVSGSRPIYRTNGTLSWLEGNGSYFMDHTVPTPGLNEFLHVFAYEAVGTSSMAPSLNWGSGINSTYPGMTAQNRANSAPTYAPQMLVHDGTNSANRLVGTTFSQGSRVDSWIRAGTVMWRDGLSRNCGSMSVLLNPPNNVRRLMCNYTFANANILNGKYYGTIYVQGATTTQQRQIAQYYLKAKSGIYVP
jgi:hypothetical protein